MANIKQQIKRNKTNIKRQQLNKSFKSSTKTAIKKVEASVLAGNYEEAVLNLNFANKKLDKGLAKGIYHRNFVANHKSKLQKLVNQLNASKWCIFFIFFLVLIYFHTEQHNLHEEPYI